MWDKFKNDGYTKNLLKKVITILLIVSIALLTFDVLTTGKDGRRQIVDINGGEEYVETNAAMVSSEEEIKLMAILKDIKGVGENQVMITYKRDEPTASVFNEETDVHKNQVEGVIITAEGANNIVVQNDIINAVSALFGIPSSKVKVFEKEGGNK